MKIKMRHGTYHLSFVSRNGQCMSPGADGECDSPNKKGRRRIYIHDDLEESVEMETMLHEILHAMFPHLSEEAVEEAARVQRKALRKRGYGK